MTDIDRDMNREGENRVQRERERESVTERV